MDRRPSRSPVNVRPVTRENVPSHRRKVLFLKCRVTVPVFDLLLSVSSPVLQINHISTVISEFFVCGFLSLGEMILAVRKGGRSILFSTKNGLSCFYEISIITR